MYAFGYIPIEAKVILRKMLFMIMLLVALFGAAVLLRLITKG